MVSDEECMRCAREYVRLAGLTDNLKVRVFHQRCEQLIASPFPRVGG
jgi:hypothetical protein